MIYIISIVSAILLGLMVFSLVSVSFLEDQPFHKTNETSPKTSVLVAARNEEENILRCLESLENIDYSKDKIEFLIGDDQSDDATSSIIEKYIQDKTNFSLVQIREDLGQAKGKANVLAQLAKQANGEYIFVTDADIAVQPGWIKEILIYFDKDTGIVSGATVATITRKPEERKWWVIGGVILLIGVVVMMEKFGSKEATRVSVEKVKHRSIVETVSASGKVQPEIEIKLSPDVSGEITDMMVKEGDSVIQGQLLARINPDIYNTDLDRTKATLDNTKATYQSSMSRITQAEAKLNEVQLNYTRSKKLHDQKVISDMEWENIQSLFNNAKAELEAAKNNLRALEFTVKGTEASVRESEKRLNRTNIYAPQSGIISKLNSEKGERVVGTSQMAGTEILRIADLNKMEMSVEVNENDIAKISLNDSAEIEVDAYSERKFKGYVTEIANSANVAGSSADQVTNFTVKVRILPSSYKDLVKPQRHYPFRPGMSGSVDIQTQRVDNVISVPLEAVGTRSPKKDSDDIALKNRKEKEEGDDDNKKKETRDELDIVVFVYKDDKAKMVKIKTGIQDDQYIEVTEGLKGDEELITGPYQAISTSLKDGEKVKKVAKKDLFNMKKK